MFKKIQIENLLAPIYVVNAFFFSFWGVNIAGLNFHLGFFGIFILTAFYLKVYGFRLSKFTKKLTLFLIPFFLFNLWWGWQMPCDEMHLKMTLSIVALAGIIILASEISQQSNKFSWHLVGNFALILLCVFLCGIILEMIYPEWWPNKSHYHSQYLWSGFATEPSFLAQLISPLVILSQLSQSRRVRFMSILSLPIFMYLCSSLTMIFLGTSVIGFLVLIKVKSHINMSKVFLLITLIIFLVVFLLIETTSHFLKDFSPYIFHRIEFIFGSFQTLNYSGLMFLQSWLDTLQSLQKTFALGAGMNQAGCFPRYPGEILELASRDGPIHQYTDGNVMLAKVIYEWGIVALILFTYLVYRSSIIFFSASNNNQKKIFAMLFFLTLLTFISRSNIYFEHTWWLLSFPFLCKIKKN